MALAPPYHILCFLVLFLMLLSFSTAQTQRNISLGSSLTAGNNDLPWESPSRDFAFGFRQIGQDGFLLAIWFNKIPDETIVWSANRDNLVQKGSKVELANSGLSLNDPKGNQIWNSKLSGIGVAYGAMLDTGNFELANQNSTNLWESFNEPMDTLLPTQTLSQGMKLIARYSETNYSGGRYHMLMHEDGNLTLHTTGDSNFVYWSSETPGSGYQVIFNQSGVIYLEAENGTILNMLVSQATSTELFYQRAIVEYDGVFRRYVYPKSNASLSKGWNMAWSQTSNNTPPNICTSIAKDVGSGACGFNSYCSLDDTQRRKCYCPPGYTFIDPNDEMKGCKPNFEPQSCDEGSGDADNFDLVSLQNTNWPFGDYGHFVSMGEDWCRKACLEDCFCVLAIVGNGGDCWKKRSPFSNGVMPDGGGGAGKALIKVRKVNSTFGLGFTDSKKKDNSTLVLIGSILLSSSAFLNVLLLAASLVLFRFRRQKSKVTSPNQFKPATNLQTFTNAELEKATYGFKERLGSGAFSTVFKGDLTLDNKSLVAVKKLDNIMKEGEKEFEAEVTAIGRTNHKNLVQLIGYCNEDQDRLLVYEFMSNGSLASFLFGPSKPSWYQRMRIALETARGLFYLHEECSTQIIHCDIKPHNVLLDDSCTARISDFGLSKVLKMDQTRTTTGIRGTKGYVAPEWFRNMAVTAKVDVYSYGILLLELICCRKSFEPEVEDDAQMILSDWAYDCYAARKLGFLVENDGEAAEDLKRVERYVMVAIWCIQEEPSLRPTMKKVTQMLEGTIEVAVPPDPTSLISSI